jgi:hypothetical protein
VSEKFDYACWYWYKAVLDDSSFVPLAFYPDSF